MVGDGSRPSIVPVDLALFGFLHASIVKGERIVVVDTGYPTSPRRIMAGLRVSTPRRAMCRSSC